MTKKKKTKLEEIEKFIVAAGSDDVGTFGGDHEGGVHLQQVPDELANFINDILEEKIENYLEIGVAAGGTCYVLNEYLKFKNIVLIDDNQHFKSQFRPQVLYGIKYNEIRARSEEPSTIQRAQEHAPYDMVLVDANHLYKFVKQDYLNYALMVKEGGLIVFHDSFFRNWGVRQLVNELRKDKTVELIKEYFSKKYKPCGISVFRKL